MSAGSSLDQAGLLEYLQDVIYLGGLLQCTTWISDWIWILSLVVGTVGYGLQVRDARWLLMSYSRGVPNTSSGELVVHSPAVVVSAGSTCVVVT